MQNLLNCAGIFGLMALAWLISSDRKAVNERTADLSSVSVRALVAATLACLMTGALAGKFFTSGSVLSGCKSGDSPSPLPLFVL